MKQSKFKRVLSLLLSVALLMGVVPFSLSVAADPIVYTPGYATDPSTAHTWESMMGTDIDGNRYAGRVWVDKSFFQNGDTANLGNGTSYQIQLEDGEDFQVVFSALGSTMSSKTTVTDSGPMDVVLILDNSVSMNTVSQGSTRMEKVINAANSLLADLLDGGDVRLGIAAYSEGASTVLPFGSYDDGVVLKVNNYTGTGSRNGVITAYNKNNRVINSSYKSAGYANYTNTQAGFDLGMEMLANATDTQNRKPVVILLTDGAANTAVDTLFDADRDGTVRQVYYSNNIDPMIALSTLLSAAYHKADVKNHYGVAPAIYGVGVDLSSTDGSNAIIDPKNNFNASNNNQNIRSAYDTYVNTWLKGQDVSVSSGTGSGFGSSRYTFRFGHEYPRGSGITDSDIRDNLGYVDTYYPVSGEGLNSVFEQIYQELSSNAFNPISSSTVIEGGAGTQSTPLIFVDFLGQYMEVKNIQAVSLFGATYNVVLQNGKYVVERATGTNPTTNELWNTAEDIIISMEEEADGTQKLEIRVNQEILPILMERVESETVGDTTSATITEVKYEPLRIFYTVGLDSDILLPNGEVDVTKIQGYTHINDANGTVSFYAGSFGQMNPPDANGVVTNGDSHVGFMPSEENRYYYYQTNQSIFVGIVDDATGERVTIPENNEYGLLWNTDDYSLIRMTYEDYLNMKDEDVVYNYVTYWRPTPSASDAANTAEEVTYLVYSNWKYVKESVCFVDAATGEYLNGGKAIPVEDVASVVEAYLASHPNAQLCAVVGQGSLRTSRLHNMTVAKEQNLSGTATVSYAPEYTYETAKDHHDNSVVVWLGNNARRTVEIATGIALTKNLTEAFGDADARYALTVTVPAGVDASPVVKDANGKVLDASLYSYVGNVLTVLVKAGETVYVSGIPAGTVCTVGEEIPADAEYYVAEQTATVTVPALSQVLNGAAQYAPVFVTNAPYKYGNLFITKKLESDHSIPASVANEGFTVRVDLGTALAGETFSVWDSASATAYEKTVGADGTLSFTLKAQQTVEILRIPANTPVTVTEIAPDAHFDVSYRSRNHSGATPDADGAVVIPETGSATVVVINSYTPDATSVDLDVVGTKRFDAPAVHASGAFHFKVQAWNGSAWVDVAGKTASVPYGETESGDKSFLMENVLEGVVFDRVGEYAYQVVEVKGSVENVTYDRSLYTFTVTVTDNGGALVATVTDRHNAVIDDGSYEVLFHNSYNTAAVSVDIVKKVENLSGDNTVPKQGFAFEAVPTDANWNPVAGGKTLTVFTDAAGEARFSATCERSGTYYYLLKEVNGNAPGWSYSAAEYRITVTVTADNSGKLSASLTVEKAGSDVAAELVTMDPSDATKATVSFVNTYDPQDAVVSLEGTVNKVLTGKTLEDGAFTFYVYADGDRSSPILTGTNKADGTVVFDKELSYSTVGKFAYDVVEAIPDGAVYDAATDRYVLNGMSYDPTIYDLVVEVRNDLATGELVAQFYFEDAAESTVSFVNSYKPAPTAYTIGGTKELHGRALGVGEFSFELYEGATLVQKVSNKADGSFLFDAISYSAAGTYTYTVKEVQGAKGGVSYDSKEYTVTVTVTDTNGVLSAVADVENSAIVFVNTYTASPAALEILVNKTLRGAENDRPADGDFSFRLYQTDLSFLPDGASSALVEEVSNQDGKASFEISFTAPGTYFFVVLEDASNPLDGVVYDRSQHRYSVQVTDNGEGQLMAKVSDLSQGEQLSWAASHQLSVDFVNARAEEVAEKQVYLAGASSVQIDGKKVNAGDVLTYFITYTNYNGVAVAVDILDAIPNHTSYVEGSASHGGSFAGGNIRWLLNVERGQSVTVSFQVKVNESEAVVANTAVVNDGVNTYYTNEVVNHTVDQALKKDVFHESQPGISADGKKVYARDQLWYEITFTNASDVAIPLQIRDQIPENATYVEGSADFGGVYADGAVTWTVDELPAWGSITVSFAVKVNADVEAVTVVNVATATDGSNSYASNQVTNYTVKDEVAKDVFFAADTTVSIDGEQVEAEDELVYTVSYKNTANETVTVTVSDTLSQYLSYVEGSASHEGVYADGVITWTLEVEAGQTVTLSFAAIVQAEGGETIPNRATVVEAQNSYETNEVKNFVKVPEPPATTAPATSAPATTAPATSAPATTAPATSAPTTAPESSAPATTAPATSAPVSSAPVTSAPESSAPLTGDVGDIHFGFLLALLGGTLAVSVLAVKKRKETQE